MCVHQLMLQSWNNSIFAAVREKLLSASMKLLYAERSGEAFDSQLVIGVRQSFGEPGQWKMICVVSWGGGICPHLKNVCPPWIFRWYRFACTANTNMYMYMCICLHYFQFCPPLTVFLEEAGSVWVCGGKTGCAEVYLHNKDMYMVTYMYLHVHVDFLFFSMFKVNCPKWDFEIHVTVSLDQRSTTKLLRQLSSYGLNLAIQGQAKCSYTSW